MKTISIVTACYNEEANVELLHNRVRAVMAGFATVSLRAPLYRQQLRPTRRSPSLSCSPRTTRRFKIIVNARNFGHIRSPTPRHLPGHGRRHRLDRSRPPGPARDDPATRRGVGDRRRLPCFASSAPARKPRLLFSLRRQYYRTRRATLLDRDHPELHRIRPLRSPRHRISPNPSSDPYPYFPRHDRRDRPARIRRSTTTSPTASSASRKNNWYTLYDIGMSRHHQSLPRYLCDWLYLRDSRAQLHRSQSPLSISCLKLVFWSTFTFGLAPMLVGVFFVASLQLVFLGVLGEYVGAIYTQVQQRPYTVELERVNFPVSSSAPPTLARSSSVDADPSTP